MPEIRTETVIAAPPEKVWRALSDLPRWGEWNPLIPWIEGDLRPGGRARFRIRLSGRALPIRVRVLRVDPERELAWRGPRSRLAGVLMRGEHYFRLSPTDDGRTRFTHGELFEGALAAAMFRRLGPTLTLAYEDMNHALARHVGG